MRKTITQKYTAVVLILMLLLTAFSSTAVYADGTEYGWQGMGAKGSEKINRMKMLDPSDIEVIQTAADQDDCYINQIKSDVPGSAGLRLTFTMDAGMNSFGDGSHFETYCMPHIKIWDAEENTVVAEYEGGQGDLKFYPELSHASNKNTGDIGKIVIGTEEGILPTGDYTIVFGPQVCGNNVSKILGAAVKFKFHLEAVPGLKQMIDEAQTFHDNAPIYDDKDAALNETDKWGKYSKSDAQTLQAAIDIAKTSTADDAAKTLYNALQSFKKSIIVGIRGVQISGIDQNLQVSDAGTAKARVTSMPDSEKYHSVKWNIQASPEGCFSFNEKTGEWTANYPGEVKITAESVGGTYKQETSLERIVHIGKPGKGITVNLAGDGTLEQTVAKAKNPGEEVSDLRITTSKGVTLSKNDFDYIRGLSKLKTLDLFKASCKDEDVDFQNNKTLEKIVLPKTLREIKSFAFAECTALNDIEIPASVADLGSGVFKNCINLPETINVWSVNPPSYVEEASNMEDIFKGTAVKSIQVPYGCGPAYEEKDGWKRYKIVPVAQRSLAVSDIQTGGLRERVEQELKRRGLDESQLDKLTIETADGAFLSRAQDISWLQKNCLNVTNLDLSYASLEDNKVKANYFKDRVCLKIIRLPENINNFGDSAFANCRSLSDIVLPKALQSIGKNAFQECKALSKDIICNAVKPPEYSGTLFPDSDKTIIVPQQGLGEYQRHDGWRQYHLISQIAISLNKTALVIEVAAKQNLIATVTAYGTYSKEISWTSSNERVASVDRKSGVVQAIKPGTATITATTLEGGVTASCTVTVKAVAAPRATAASAGYNKTKVTWSGISGAAGYEVYRAAKPNGSYSKLRTLSASSRSYTDTGRTTGTAYYYKVRAYKTINGTRYLGDYSSVVSAKPALAKVAKVKARKGGSKKIKVTWKRTTGASGYTVYRSLKKNKGYKAVKTIKKAKAVKYTTGKLKKGKRYYFKVRAYRKVSGKKVYGAYSSAASYKAK